MNKEYTLKFLQQRGINITTLDVQGVLEWGKECRERLADGGAPPSATFTIDAFTASITYISGSGRTRILIPQGEEECVFFSLDAEGEDHIQELQEEILLLIEDETLRKYLGVRDIYENSEAWRIERDWIELAIHLPTRLTQGF